MKEIFEFFNQQTADTQLCLGIGVLIAFGIVASIANQLIKTFGKIVQSICSIKVPTFNFNRTPRPDNSGDVKLH